MLYVNRDLIRRFVASVDWGFTNPGVIQVWGVDGDGRMYRVREVYRTRRLIGWWVEKAKAIHHEFGIEAFACDPAEPGFIAEFRNAGLDAIQAKNDIKLGIQAIQARLKAAADGRPRIFLLDGVLDGPDEDLAAARKPTSTLEEFELYAYPKGVDGRPVKELPVDDNNHGLDAARYAVMYVDSTPAGGRRLAF